MPRRRYDLIVFDWDGTLADSTGIIARSIREAVPDEMAARYVIGLGLADALRTVAPTLPIERHPELVAHYRKRYLAAEQDIPMFEGAVELLAELDRAGYFLGVATGKSRMGLDRVLTKNGLATRFHATRCADEGRPKPHPDMLLHVMDRLGVAPEATLMIGDTTHDLLLAKNAGVAAVAVTYGAHEREPLARLAPIGTVHSIAELAHWLREHG
jgi:phosphoglycolate phosphatase